MPNARALQYGVYYHIFNRGNSGENIFLEERNYGHFLRLCAKYVVPVADMYAYCLLRNHFHLLVRIKTAEEQLEAKTFGVAQTPKVLKVLKPSQQFSNWFNAYAKAINKAHGRSGSLFERPFHRIAVADEAHFRQLVTYIHRNPQKHGLVGDFREWPYTSYHTLLSTRPTRLRRDEVLAWYDGAQGLQDAHRQDAAAGEITPLVVEDSA